MSPVFDDRRLTSPWVSARRDHNRRQHHGSDSNGKASYDIAAFEHVFQKSHSRLLSLATIAELALGLQSINSTHVRKFLAERTTLRFDAVIINS